MAQKVFPFIAVALFLASCTSTKLAQQTANNDDVYNPTVTAKEVNYAEAKKDKTYRTDEQLYGDDQYAADPYYDYDYANRINRFYYGSPYTNYYSGIYNDPFFYNNYYTPGIYLGFGFGSSLWGFNNFGYGYPYYNNYWGPLSYNSYFPGYGYGYGYGYGGGYYYPGTSVTSGNYRARPTRGSENIGVTPGAIGTVRRNGDGTIINSRPSRGEIYQGRPQSGSSGSGNISRPPASSTRQRPSRSESGERPSQGSAPQRTRMEAPPREYNPPVYNSPSPSSYGGGGGGGSQGGGGGGRSRPSR